MIPGTAGAAAARAAAGRPEPVRERLARLARVTAALGSAATVDEVTEIVTSHGADAVGATMASLTVRDGEDRVRLLGLRGGLADEAEAWASYPLSTATPPTDVIRTGARVVVTGLDELVARYPGIPDMDRYGDRSVVCLPLRVLGRSMGAIGLSFPGRPSLDPTVLEFLEILADTCAQALDRIRTGEEAEQQRSYLSFLADASSELAASLDYQATLARVAHLAVPRFADWCAIDLVRDGRLHRVAVAHVDPEKVRLAEEMHRRYPPDPHAAHGTWQVIRTGRSELIPRIPDELLVASARDDEQLRLARDLRLHSALIVPLVTRERVLGSITWVMAESRREYTAEHRTLAENVAQRAAVAIDNAELYSETHEAAVRLQRAVMPEEVPDVPGWDIASFYRPAGRTEVGGDFHDVIEVGDGRLVLVVGDVMGRGVAAAAAMAQARSAVRAYTAVDPAPGVVLPKLDLMFAQHPTDQLVTLVYLMVDPGAGELVVANAGHPPPALLHADGSTALLPRAEGCPLGVQDRPERREVRVPLLGGDTVVAYTDGLVERRDEDIDAGLERLLAVLPALATTDLATALDEVVERVRAPERNDDMAALAARLRC